LSKDKIKGKKEKNPTVAYTDLHKLFAQVSLKSLLSALRACCAFLSDPIFSLFSLHENSGVMSQQRQTERGGKA